MPFETFVLFTLTNYLLTMFKNRNLLGSPQSTDHARIKELCSKFNSKIGCKEYKQEMTHFVRRCILELPTYVNKEDLRETRFADVSEPILLLADYSCKDWSYTALIWLLAVRLHEWLTYSSGPCGENADDLQVSGLCFTLQYNI